MKIVKRIAQYVYCIYALLVFVALMLIVLVIVPPLLLPGKERGGNAIYKVLRAWGNTWYILVGIRHKEIYEAPNNRKQQFVFVANHISYLDIPAAVCCMHQRVRVLGKYEMMKFPVFGWIYSMAVITVDRTSAATRVQSVRTLRAALKRGISIFIFPEGTFNETGNVLKSFYDGAFRIAIQTQTPLKPIILPDGLRRMHYRGFFELTPGICRVVYLEEISVSGLTLKDVPALKQKVYAIMEAALVKYNYKHT